MDCTFGFSDITTPFVVSVGRGNSSFMSRLPCTAVLLDSAMLDGNVTLGNRATQDDEELSEMVKGMSIALVGLFL